MKLMIKTVILTGLTWFLFLVVVLFGPFSHSLFNIISFLILFPVILTCLIYFAILRRINKLNKQITAISSNKTALDHVEVLGNDELSSIAFQVNGLLSAKKLKQSGLSSAETDLSDNREYLASLARKDSLTALPNRLFFNEILNKTISHIKRRNKILAILLIDLDAFKNINNRLGQQVGDEVLKEIGRRLTSILRTEDVLARLDGDEFIVLLNDIGKAKFASAVAEKILKVCSEPLTIQSEEITLTASIGICIYPNDGNSLEDLLKNADNALYKVKNTGGNSYQFYTPEMDAEAHEYIELETALRNAIKNNEFTLYYQPKFHIKKGAITGVEALIRWIHPTLGIINPAKFIPIAEDTGMILQIDEWAMREACKTNKAWQDEGYEHFSVAINLSSKQFHNKKIADVITAILTETGLHPSYLEIEMTETTVMNDAEGAIEILNKIKETGVQLSIDHFGTGFTSISHLKQYPISSIKVDQNFIKGVPTNPSDSAIVSAVIALAHNLGLEVVAEGVETAEQVQYLGVHNCDMVQGYYLSHPLPAAKIILQFKKLSDEVNIQM